ncbi:hypothetical protein Dimus_008088, partial [Dionaea muscipula]
MTNHHGCDRCYLSLNAALGYFFALTGRRFMGTNCLAEWIAFNSCCLAACWAKYWLNIVTAELSMRLLSLRSLMGGYMSHGGPLAHDLLQLELLQSPSLAIDGRLWALQVANRSDASNRRWASYWAY